jgi:hypothetical protein
MMVVPDYRGFRIEVNAVAVDGRYTAEVRIWRLFAREKPQVEMVSCLKMTPDLAEHSGEIWARRWVDLRAKEGA